MKGINDSIEHILPESPGSDWPDYDENTDYRFIYRLANYTLLTQSENRDIGNKGYAEKKSAYENSDFQITRKVSEDNSSWDPGRIANRQKVMAKWATSIWRLA